MNDLIYPKKAAEMFGVTTTTLRNWEVAGKITAVKTLGGHRRYSLVEIEKMLAVDKSNK